MRGRSYSRSPPRGGYGRRRRSPSPRGRYRGHDSDAPTSLLVRNLPFNCRPEDLKRPFSDFGPVKDVYLPRDYYSGEPRGFGFVQFRDPDDAADAKHRMDGRLFRGRELTVVFAEDTRKRPADMRARERPRGRYSDSRRSPARYSRSPRNSRSPFQQYERSRSRSRDNCSPPSKRRQESRSVSPENRKLSRKRSYSHESRERSYSRSPPPPNNSQTQGRSRSQSRGKSQSRSLSPDPAKHLNSRGADRERSPSQ